MPDTSQYYKAKTGPNAGTTYTSFDVYKQYNQGQLDPIAPVPASAPAPTRAPGQSISDFTNSFEPAPTTPSSDYAFTSEEDFRTRTGLPNMSSVSVIQRGQTPSASLYKYSDNPTVYQKATQQVAPAPATPQPIAQTSESERAAKRAAEIQKIKDSLNIGEAPVLPDIFGEQDQASLNLARQERTTITTEMEGITAERLKLQEEFRVFQQTSGQGVTEAGRQGIETEQGRKIQNQLDSLNRRELVLETKLSNRNSVISELMGLQKQEYTDAVANYNQKFSQALQLYSIFDANEDELKTNAKANLDVLASAYGAQIEAGKITFDQITPLQQGKLEEYETQAGLPIGSTMAVLGSMKPGEEKLWSGVDDSGTFSYITKDASGKITIKKIAGATAPSKSGGGTQTERLLTRQSSVIAETRKLARGTDGKVNPIDYLLKASEYIENAGSATDFLAALPTGEYLTAGNAAYVREQLTGKAVSGGDIEALLEKYDIKSAKDLESKRNEIPLIDYQKILNAILG